MDLELAEKAVYRRFGLVVLSPMYVSGQIVTERRASVSRKG
jgi:hypothetical protein